MHFEINLIETYYFLASMFILCSLCTQHTQLDLIVQGLSSLYKTMRYDSMLFLVFYDRTQNKAAEAAV
jgi:hypothetical protein